MKTAIQELMELNDFLKIMGVTIEWEKYLKKEKDQIIDAVSYGCSDWGSSKDAEKYYNENYNRPFEMTEKDIHDWNMIESLKEKYQNK